MCIVFWESECSLDRPLILAANRDEFLARPTTSASWHDFSLSPALHTIEATTSNRTLSGLDLEGGGTWLGLALPSVPSTSAVKLRFSTLTNFTETITPSARPSRGNLVSKFLSPSRWTVTLEEYLHEIESTKHEYAGFNLLLGELGDDGKFRMGYASNRESEDLKARVLEGTSSGAAGRAYGLSNYTLEAQEGEVLWPKVVSGTSAFRRAIEDAAGKDDKLIEDLWRVLSTATPTPVTQRAHLRHTILVRPTFLNPKAPYPPTNPTPYIPSDDSPPAVDDLSDLTNTEKEGDDGGRWYATRVQTILIVERLGDGEKVKISFRERDAYILDQENRIPKWSGLERRFEFEV